VLVSPEFVLTAAFCTSYPPVLSIGRDLKIGALCGGFDEPAESDNCDQEYDVRYIDELIVHPKFQDTWKIANNYALIKLNEPTNITPATLDNGTALSNYEPGKKLWALGMGNTNNGWTSSRLQHIEAQYVDGAACEYQWNYLFEGQNVTDTMCARVNGNGDGPQFGDNGGPLYDADSDVVVGIHTDYSYWGPDLYTSISDEYGWISNTICDNHGEPKPVWCGTIPTAAPTHSFAPTSEPTAFTCPETEGTFVLELMQGDGLSNLKWELIDGDSDSIIDAEYDFWPGKEYLFRKCLACDAHYKTRLYGRDPPEWFTIKVSDRLLGESISTELSLSYLIDFEPCHGTCEEGISLSLSMLTQLRQNFGPYEIGWSLEDLISGEVVESGAEKNVFIEGDTGYTGYLMDRCLPCSQYKFTFYDSGCTFCLPHNMYNVTVDGQIIAYGIYETHYERSIVFTGDNCPSYPTPAPTTLSPTPSSSCSEDELSFDLKLKLEDYSDFNWYVQDALTNDFVGLSGSGYWAHQYAIKACLSCGKYSFTINQPPYRYFNGEFELKVDDELIVSGGQNSDDFKTYNFTSEHCPPAELPSEKNSTFFFFKKNAKGKDIKKTCGWLRKKAPAKQLERVCSARKFQLYSKQIWKAPASIQCFETCAAYCPKEIGMNKFVATVDLLGMAQKKPFVFKNCNWLKRQDSRSIYYLCSQDRRTKGTMYATASKACPRTCNSCSS
jgi:hypothetical protein